MYVTCNVHNAKETSFRSTRQKFPVHFKNKTETAYMAEN